MACEPQLLFADYAFANPNCSLVYSEPPPWKQLIGCALDTQERVSLITDIFSEQDESDAVEHLHRQDAQAFVDVMYEVSSQTFQPL